ncbi:MAG TPA: class II glutamine amidotransferase [Xanthobacteraceae bacterium]|jgi:predicted glutamine amidotransferase
MCRVLMYQGAEVRLDDLLYQPDNSLIKQVYDSQFLKMLNLAGFGMLAWDRSSHYPDIPFSYRSASIPIFDRNLKDLAEKLLVSSVIAHVRGVPYDDGVTVGEQNLHPFLYKGHKIALAHNGHLAGFERMRFALLEHIKPAIAQQIRGNTDTEWLYALLLSQFDDPTSELAADEIVGAVERMLATIRQVRDRCQIHISSPANLFIGNGISAVAVRFAFDYGCYDMNSPEAIRRANHDFLSLWYTMGTSYCLHDGEWKMISAPASADGSILISSEPLTRDTSTWFEVPEYTAIIASTERGRQEIRFRQLEV